MNMIKVFHFKSLKLVLGKTSTNQYIGYSVDTKYPEYSRTIMRGSAKEIVEECIYLYKARLLTAYNCESYEGSPYGIDHSNFDIEVRDWVEYVLNRYLFSPFNMGYEHTYRVINYSYVATDGTPCSLDDYIEDGITIKHW